MKLYIFILILSSQFVSYNANLIANGRNRNNIDSLMTNKAYPDFITASRNLDIKYLKRVAKNNDERQYIKALENIVINKIDSVEYILFELAHNSKDSLILTESKLLLEVLLLANSKWKEVLKIHPNPLNNNDVYYSHAKAWSKFKETEYIFPENGISQPVVYTKNGQPILRVSINGKVYHFILDTGAQFSVISSKVANECSISQIEVEGFDIESMFSKPGIIPSLGLSDAEIKNLPVMILDSKDLNIRFFGLFTTMKIDGIIGWPQIKNLRIELDNIQHTLKIAKSSIVPNQNPNLIFYFRPVVKIAISSKAPSFFWFDTGKGKTSFFMRGAKKLQQEYTSKGFSISSMSSKMGGSSIQKRKILKNVSFNISGQIVEFDQIDIEKKDNPFFDGWMGLDICQNKRIIIDFRKGQIILENQ